MEVLSLVAPVRRFVGLTVPQLLLVQLRFVLLLATTKSTKLTFIRRFSTLLLSLSCTSACSTTVSTRQVPQWADRGHVRWTDDFRLPARPSGGGCRIFGGRQRERGWGTVKLRVRVVMCRV